MEDQFYTHVTKSMLDDAAKAIEASEFDLDESFESYTPQAVPTKHLAQTLIRKEEAKQKKETKKEESKEKKGEGKEEGKEGEKKEEGKEGEEAKPKKPVKTAE